MTVNWSAGIDYNRFAMICLSEAMDHLILGIASMVMTATHVQLGGLQRQTTPAETCQSVMLNDWDEVGMKDDEN